MLVTLVCVITTFFIPESPKYLYEKGHYKKSRDTLCFIRRCNLRGSDKLAFRFDGEATRDFTKAIEIYQEAKEFQASGRLKDLVKNPVHKLNMILSTCMWIVASCNYYLLYF